MTNSVHMCKPYQEMVAGVMAGLNLRPDDAAERVRIILGLVHDQPLPACPAHKGNVLVKGETWAMW